MLVTVFYTCLKETGTQCWLNLLESLPQNLGHKIGNYIGDRAKAQRIAGKYLLLKLLEYYKLSGQYSLNDLTYSLGNKPFFAGSRFEFSLSHSGDFVLCIAATNGKVGIDIEQHQGIRTDLLQPYFDRFSRGLINASETPVLELYTQWVRREAAIKASGLGMEQVDIGSLKSGTGYICIGKCCYYTMPLLLAEGYSVAIASQKRITLTEVKKIMINDALQ